MEKWREEGHGCPPCYDYLKQKYKEETDERWEALERLSGRGRIELVKAGRPREFIYSKKNRTAYRAI